MIVDTCKEFKDIGGVVGIKTMMLLTCGLCDKRKKCHAEIRKQKEKANG